MCGAPEQTAELPPGTDLEKESVLVGRVTASGSPVAGANVSHLDAAREFTAAVVSTGSGAYRLVAAPGLVTTEVTVG